MAQPDLLSDLVPAILEKMTSPIINSFKSILGIDAGLRQLEKRLRNAQSVLEEAEEKQLEDISIRLWLSELKGAAYAVDGIVNDLQLEFQRRKEIISQRRMGKTRGLIRRTSHNPLSYRMRMERWINVVVDRFDDIVAPESMIAVLGRREDRKDIVEMLLSQEVNNGSITLLPVEVGVCVSEAILESVKGSRFDSRLRQMLSSKRYILVSDEDVTRWEQMKLLMSSFGGMALVAPLDDERDRYGIETSSFLLYSFAEIRVATYDFSESSKIGKGGYGSVYKGKLRGTIVAVKMLDSLGRQSRQEFFQELDVLCQMKHQNLVNLLGACFECYALVYEFLPNGSLEDSLKNCSSLLTWKIRTRIIFDICSSLNFLHSRSVVHGDIKPHNILLDASFNGKLADFGLCRFLPKGTSFVETGPKGTFEYIDLNFLETGILRPSSDLYSFGVTILKLVTGQQPLGLGRRVSDAHKNTFDFREMVDATAGPWPLKLAHELAYWGLQCCYHNENSSQLMEDMWICLEEILAEIN